MPLYEYTCRACHTDFERLTPASRRDTPETVCPHCGQTKVARKISLTAHRVVHSGGSSRPTDFDCGAPGGCCGGACSIAD